MPSENHGIAQKSAVVSVHRDSEWGDLENSGITWGALVQPGFALVRPEPGRGVIEWSSEPLRVLAAPPTPTADSLFDAPVTRTLVLRSPDGRTYLALQADLTGWTLPAAPPWSPPAAELFDAGAADLADRILSHCTAPPRDWFELAGKARAEQRPMPRPYPFSAGPGAPTPWRFQKGCSTAPRKRASWIDALDCWL